MLGVWKTDNFILCTCFNSLVHRWSVILKKIKGKTHIGRGDVNNITKMMYQKDLLVKTLKEFHLI